MKLPVIRHLNKHNSKEALAHTVDVLESFTEHRSVKEEEMDIIGELITNLCGAIEMHDMIEHGMEEREAANSFAQKVMGSIDR